MENQTTPQTAPRSLVADLALPAAIVIAGGLIAAAVLFGPQNSVAKDDAAPQAAKISSSEAAKILALRPDDHVRGSRDARILMVEYSDTECPFCIQFHPELEDVVNTEGKDGSIAWVYRYFPLSIHPKANKEAEALECAAEQGGEDAFWKLVDKIFATTPGNNQLDPAELPKLAKSIGLDDAKLSACIASGKYTARVNRDLSDGAKLGVRGTPYLMVWDRQTNAQVPIPGAYPEETILSAIRTLLGKK